MPTGALILAEKTGEIFAYMLILHLLGKTQSLFPAHHPSIESSMKISCTIG